MHLLYGRLKFFISARICLPLLAALLAHSGGASLSAADEILRFSTARPVPLSVTARLIQTQPAAADQAEVLVEIRAQNTAAASVFPLQNPARVIVDLPSDKPFATKNLVPKANPLLSAVRIGAPVEKMRIVLDLSDPGAPDFKVAKTGDMLRVSLLKRKPLAQEPPRETAPPAATAAADAPLAEPSLSPTPPSTPTATSTIALTSTSLAQQSPAPSFVSPITSEETLIAAAPAEDPVSLPAPSALPILEPPPEPTATAAAFYPTNTAIPATPASAAEAPTVRALVAQVPLPAGRQTLVAIDFESVYFDQAQGFRLSLTLPPQFKLSKKSERSYSLLISDSIVGGDHLKLVHFPPQHLPGLTHVLAGQKGSDVEITIGVERGIRILAVARGTDILVRTITR